MAVMSMDARMPPQELPSLLNPMINQSANQGTGQTCHTTLNLTEWMNTGRIQSLVIDWV